jgi:RND family efflux transporter MFP subunit
MKNNCKLSVYNSFPSCRICNPAGRKKNIKKVKLIIMSWNCIIFVVFIKRIFIMVNLKCFAGLLLLAGLFACGQKEGAKNEEDEESVETVLPTETVTVRAETLRTQEFEHEIVSNGRISAQQIAELRFAAAAGSNVPVKIFVQNGAFVAAGTAIAMLDTFLLSNSYSQAVDNLRKARLDLQDVLIGQGYQLADSALIPPEVFTLASIRSGYNNAQTQYALAKYNLDNAILRAPIAGTVANLFAKPYSTIDNAEPFCIVIHEGQLEVDFKILENELPLLRKGDRVKIQPYASADIVTAGSIVDINPSIDKDGTVRIKASVNAHPRLFNGMNVRIGVYRSAGKQWVVPKSAVVLRTGKQVVFAYKDGKAAWHYVETGLENATHYTITGSTLQEGDEVIYYGNEHLADGTNVTLMVND